MTQQTGQAARIVILTGAGVSAESGIATFRASDGLWEQHRIEDVATPEGFALNPLLVQQFYNQRRAQLASVVPNPGHIALARLQQAWPGEVLLVTQNVDDLHERAGSPDVLHMHGELLKVRCVRSGHVVLWRGDVTPQTSCQCCADPQVLRPHIVWFGEMPLEMDRISNALWQADLFISVGTSGNVYPAAGFVAEAKQAGAVAIECNLEPSLQKSRFDYAWYGPSGVTLPLLVERLLADPDHWQTAIRPQN